MNKELDEQLCKDYPLIFANRHGDMATTAMCWGFDCGDGWYPIIDKLCYDIQHHIDWQKQNWSNVIKYNEALALYLNHGDTSALVDWYTYGSSEPNENTYKRVAEAIIKASAHDTPTYREVPKITQQVLALQVKEKFGTLSFYYTGGDDVISGMVRMAESMSSVMCETCGNAGKLRGSGWLYTACDEHVTDFDKERGE